MILDHEPRRFAVVESNFCKHCSKPIQKRLILGWVHTRGTFFMCVLQPKDGKYLVAEPEIDQRRRSDL
jgi:hypothetical protein